MENGKKSKATQRRAKSAVWGPLTKTPRASHILTSYSWLDLVYMHRIGLGIETWNLEGMCLGWTNIDRLIFCLFEFLWLWWLCITHFFVLVILEFTFVFLATCYIILTRNMCCFNLLKSHQIFSFVIISIITINWYPTTKCYIF